MTWSRLLYMKNLYEFDVPRGTLLELSVNNFHITKLLAYKADQNTLYYYYLTYSSLKIVSKDSESVLHLD